MNQPGRRIGLFLCRCGTNIANFVDLDELSRWAGTLESVAFVQTHNLLCSPDGKKFVAESIRESGAEAIVVAACSPKMHEKTFREAAGQAGTNLAQVQMANIREQCGWVTADKGQATAKAQALISAALQRVALHEDLQPRSMECQTDVVVIGGGIAGIEAALAAASAGRTVTIIEKEISLGGMVIKTEEVAPNMECAPCLLAPRLAAVRDNKNITVVANATVTDVLGFFGNFTVRATRKARYVKSSCIGCEACFEACPVAVPSAFHLGLGTHKAIHTAFAGSVPAAAVIERDHCRHFGDGSCSACVENCPFGAIDFEDTDTTVEIKAGAVVVATGSDTFDPSGIGRLGYGSIANVYTLAEFERIASSNGPTGGEIRLRDGSAPASIGVIHCVGSLCAAEGVDYCSGVCCMAAAKVGELARKKLPGVAVVNIHDRLVFEGRAMQDFLAKQHEEGTRFIRTEALQTVSLAEDAGRISISIAGTAVQTVDMVVLATASVPSRDTARLAELLSVDVDPAGFFKADHPVLRSTGSSLDGIYAVGGCTSPCTTGVAVTRGLAAIGDIAARLVPGRKIELEVMTTVIDEKLCAGCRMCIAVCPYKAISFDREANVSRVNEAICRGCGTCAATCPGGAATARHFTNEQIYAEIGGVLHGNV